MDHRSNHSRQYRDYSCRVPINNAPEQERRPREAAAAASSGSYSLSMVYSPFQRFDDLYSPENALVRGTLFAELDLPFEGARRNCR